MIDVAMQYKYLPPSTTKLELNQAWFKQGSLYHPIGFDIDIHSQVDKSVRLLPAPPTTYT